MEKPKGPRKLQVNTGDGLQPPQLCATTQVCVHKAVKTQAAAMYFKACAGVLGERSSAEPWADWPRHQVTCLGPAGLHGAAGTWQQACFLRGCQLAGRAPRGSSKHWGNSGAHAQSVTQTGSYCTWWVPGPPHTPPQKNNLTPPAAASLMFVLAG